MDQNSRRRAAAKEFSRKRICHYVGIIRTLPNELRWQIRFRMIRAQREREELFLYRIGLRELATLRRRENYWVFGRIRRHKITDEG